jgi:Family of unknown function (DUF5684)
MVLFLVFYLAFIVFIIASVWKTFEKANQPGWACIIPIYSFYVMAKIGGVKNWWLCFIPIANIYILFVVMIAIAKSFGKDTGFGIGLVFLGFIFFPMLGFGSASYIGPNGVNELQNNVNAIGRN